MPSSDDSVKSRRYLALAQDLLTSITRGELKPGDRLPPHNEFAARANVSRATAREAFLALELIGAIEVRHGDGTFVSRQTARVGGTQGSPLDTPPQELIETRLYLEPLAAGLAAKRIDSERVATLGRYLDEQFELINEPDQVARFVSLGLQFHADLAPGCGNHLFADIIAQLVNVETHPLWALVNQRGLPTAALREAQVNEHRAVLDAVRSGEPDTAYNAMRDHLADLDNSMFGRTHTPLGGTPHA